MKHRTRRLLILLLAVCSIPAAAQRRPLAPDALAAIRAEEPRRIRFATDRLNEARFRLGLNDNHTFEFRSALTDRYGALRARYRQKFKGIRVLSGGAIAHIDDQDRFLEPSTKLFTDIDLIETTPSVDAAGARAAILAELARINPPGSTDPLIQPELVIVPQRELVFTEDPTRRVLPAVPALEEYSWTTKGYQLAWLALTSADESRQFEAEPRAFLVHAFTGAILRVYSLRADDAPRTAARGTARTFHHGTVDLATSRNDETGQFELTDPTRGGNTVLDLFRGVSLRRGATRPFTNGSNSWGDGGRFSPANDTQSPNGQTLAADVAFGMERTWDVLKNVFGHEGPDGKASPFEARVHYGTGLNDAFWHRTAKAVFFGSGTADGPPPSDLETVAHELGHAFWYALIDSEGGSDSEADGINQGNADILASLAEFYHRGNQGRGGVLADVAAEWNFRPRMVNPASVSFTAPGSAPQPGLVYWTANAAAQEEHAVGALYGHLFVLLARGASPQPSSPLYSRFFPNGMAGVGLQTAADLWYLATAGYLPDEPTFFELRQAFLRAAAYLYGEESSVYATVLNAFAAIGLGSPAVDSIPPSVSNLTIESLDEGEGSLLVSASAADDTGILQLEFLLNNTPALTRPFPPYRGYLDISRLGVGSHVLTARAIDYSSKVGFTTVPVVVKGVNQVIGNGGFEEGEAKWTSSPGVIRGGAADSFLGERHAAFSTSAAFLAQTVSIPQGATSAALAFRLRIENQTAPSSGARLDLQIRDDRGTLLETPGTWFDSAVPADALTNNYARHTFNLAAHRGRRIELRFVASIPSPGPVRFRIDGVNLIITEPVGAEAAAEADDNEGSLILRLKTLSGVQPSQVSRVDYIIDNDVFASSTAAPFAVVQSTQGLIRRAYNVSARVYDIGGALLVETAQTTFALRDVNQLIRNGGFELAAQSWTTTGQTTFPADTSTSQRAFTGTRCALLGGRGATHTDELSQTFDIPSEASNVTLTFRLRIDSNERMPVDELVVRVFERTGGRPRELLRVNSRVDTRGADSVKGYVKRTYDLTEYAGASVVVHFQGREDTGPQTSFFIDNVGVTYR